MANPQTSKDVSGQPQFDPTANVLALVEAAVTRINDIHKVEIRRIDDKIAATKDYVILSISDDRLASDQRFEAQQLALKDALISQEKAVAAALEGTKEAISKADATTDKRFDLLSEKIDGVSEKISTSSGERGIYVTHTDLTIALDKLQQSIEGTLRPVVAFMNSQTGNNGGQRDMFAWIISGIMVLIAIASFLLPHLK